MITCDGWRVVVVDYDGHQLYRVTHLGILVGSLDGTLRWKGRVASIDAVRKIMGDAFARLEEE